jgi:hypothetical protein
MRVSLFQDFGAKNSAPVFAAFQQGLHRCGITAVSHDFTADIAVIWSVVWAGRMRANRDVWRQFRSTGRPVIVLEVGMLKRGETWKMAVNGTGSGAKYCESREPNRPQHLGLALRPWRRSGSHVLIAMQRGDSEQWSGMPATDQWLSDTVRTLRQYTDREIRVRSHPRQKVVIPNGCTVDRPLPIMGTYDSYDLGRGINNTWAVINHNSGPGSQGIMLGYPAFVDASSLAAPVANLDLANIENPMMPDRDQWLIDLSHSEWTVPELAGGAPVREIVSLAQTL